MTNGYNFGGYGLQMDRGGLGLNPLSQGIGANFQLPQSNLFNMDYLQDPTVANIFSKYGIGGAGGPQVDTSWFGKLGGMEGIGAGLQGLGALGSMFTGFKNYGLAKDQLKFQKQAFNKNFENQKKLTNARLEDRQRQRHAANPYMNARPEDYMAKHGV